MIKREKHIVSFSGGKDSTAMLLMMIEKNMQIDEVVFCDTGKEFPGMYEHIEKVKRIINRDITILRAENSFDYMMFQYTKKKGKNKGSKGYAWPSMMNRWCTTYLKNQVISKYLKKYKDYEVIEYIGIAADEMSRVKNKRYPLVDWNINEAEALEYCYQKGLDWGGLYKQFKRVSCWCCPLKSIPELKALWKYYPDLWIELKSMDKKSWNKFRLDYSLEELEDRFTLEERQLRFY